MRTVFQRKDIAHVPDAVNIQNSSQMICARIVNAKKVMIKGEKIMKKTLSLFLAMLLVLSSMLTLASCGSESGFNDDNKIYLSLENYEQYLNVSARYYGEDGRWSSLFSRYNYGSIVSSVTIASTSSFVKFYNCVIEVRIVGEYYYTAYDKKTTDETIKVTLSIGGSGSGSKIENVLNDNAHDIKGMGYEVVSVSGYVIVD